MQRNRDSGRGGNLKGTLLEEVIEEGYKKEMNSRSKRKQNKRKSQNQDKLSSFNSTPKTLIKTNKLYQNTSTTELWNLLTSHPNSHSFLYTTATNGLENKTFQSEWKPV